jgi:predicted unusual protein kinase regulating ubiquinone biosynthesis (AarF/ABC1/UbiB family)
MPAKDRLPVSKAARSAKVGRMALELGVQAARKAIQSPFLSVPDKQRLDLDVSKEQGRILFRVFSQMKGVPLKLAQTLSLEAEFLPDEIRTELAKSCYSVPPINRGLVRKILTQALDKPIEEVFPEFDYVPFAAASLGQVHRAVDRNGSVLAVKIQYPGIGSAIQSDLAILKTFSTYLPLKMDLKGAMAEVEGRLQEELSYLKEAEWTAWFGARLRLPGVRIPQVADNLCAENVLTTSMLPGIHLDKWLENRPSQKRRDDMAHRLFGMFLHSVYDLHALHADPNPGNFLIDQDDNVGLLDFGCVKRFDPGFPPRLAALMRLVVSGSGEQALQAFCDNGFITATPGRVLGKETNAGLLSMVGWIKRPYQAGRFDFRLAGSFFEDGRRLGLEFISRNPAVSFSPEFIFLDRVRYGLYRIFQKLGARVDLNNRWETPDWQGD